MGFVKMQDPGRGVWQVKSLLYKRRDLSLNPQQMTEPGVAVRVWGLGVGDRLRQVDPGGLLASHSSPKGKL